MNDNPMLQALTPVELKTRQQWVCWRREVRDGKQTKIPYRADGKGMASTTDPTTWASYESVIKAYQAGGYDGIGFVFSPDDPFTGIDLDHCRDPQTGEIDPWAMAIIESLKSYTEVTPSDTGVHIITKGKLPPGGNRKGKLEVYDRGRYFTITGAHLEGTPGTIEERQHELTDLHARTFPKALPANEPGGNGLRPVGLGDAELISKAMAATNGATFTSLWKGDTSAHGGDDSAADLALCSHLAFWTGNDPTRIDSLFRQSSLYREKWERQDYRDRTINKAIASTGETYSPAGYSLKALTELNKPAAENRDTVRAAIPTTDTGNAEYLASLFSSQVRHDHRRRRWLLWRRHHWEPDRDGHTSRLAVESARQRYRESVNIEDLKERQRVAAWAISSESRMRIEACLSIARSVKPIADSGENWDSDPWLLGVNNGVIDLRTGELRAGRPDDHITMSAGVDFDPEAKCPRWEQFLTEVFSDAELVDWLWRALGYSLSGDTTEQCIFMGYGIGANGKGVLTTAFHGALGDYAYSSPFSTFELYQRASIPNDLAALEFKRFVNSSETNDNTRLNEARIKAISGCDPITARYLHQEYFTFWPHLKLWLFVNHKPKVIDDSFGFWRRVRLIPFTKQFTGEADDRRLGEKLRAEAPGILAWLVKGCLEWRRRGLEPIPECVKVATQEYREESDILAGFVGESCIEHPKATIKASELYSAYKDWAESQGMRDREVLTSTAFGRRMRERYQKDKKGGTVYYYGIGLSGQLQDSSEANITENDVSPIYNASHERNRKTILNYPIEAKSGENYPANEDALGMQDYPTSPCPICGCADYWLREASALGGPTEWVCSRCHPKTV